MNKFTVVIPTRNNIDTLPFTLQTCLNQCYDNYQIVISDNGDDDSTRNYIDTLNDNRIKYYHTGKPLSMTENFEFALSKVNEGFIMFIGADDGLMPGAVKYVDSIVRKFNIKAVACQYAQYFWPNAQVPFKGRLVRSPLNYFSSGVELRNSSEWIKKTLAFETELYTCDLPSLYYGFIERSIVDMAFKDGKYFRSITPDSYSAFATAINIDTYAYSFKPFCIAGLSGKSNGLSQATNGEIAKQFVSENKYPIHKSFFYCSALEIIAGEAFYQLKDAFPEKCKDASIDFKLLINKILEKRNKSNFDEITKAAMEMALIHNIDNRELEISPLRKMCFFWRRTLKFLKLTLNSGSKILGMDNSELYGVKNVYDAAVALSVIEGIYSGHKLETVKEQFLRRIKKRLKLLSNKNSL